MKRQLYAVLLLLSLCTSCKEYDHPEENIAAMTISEAPMALADKPTPSPPNGGEVNVSQQIIKNGRLRFETNDLNATADKVQDAVKKYGGQVQTDNEATDNYSLSRTIILRIPAANFETFINQISNGVNHFDVKEISSDDVTEEYIDVDARVKAKKVLEARYFELLKKANKVTEMLEIEKQISALREEIESQEGRLRYIKSRVAMSTIHIEFYKNIESGGGTTVSYGSKMGNAIKSGFNSLSTFLLQLLNIWPFILIFVIVFIIIRKKIKKKRNNNA
jgi:hypothetical protein